MLFPTLLQRPRPFQAVDLGFSSQAGLGIQPLTFWLSSEMVMGESEATQPSRVSSEW